MSHSGSPFGHLGRAGPVWHAGLSHRVQYREHERVRFGVRGGNHAVFAGMQLGAGKIGDDCAGSTA